MGRPQLGILFAGGLGHLFEALDIVIIGFMLPHLKTEFGLSNGQIGLIGGAAPVGMIVGVLFAGMIGDRFGRKKVMLYALLLFCAASIGLAFANGFVFVIAVRIIGGLGAGAEAAIVSPYISEFATGHNRGRFVSGVTLFFSLGNVIAAVLGSFVVPLHDGWRITAVLCGLPVLVLLWWRRSLPESPRWLLAQGRVADADAVVSRLEERVIAARRGAALPPFPRTPPWRRPHRRCPGSRAHREVRDPEIHSHGRGRISGFRLAALDFAGESDEPASTLEPHSGRQDACGSRFDTPGELAGGLVRLERPQPGKCDVVPVRFDADGSGGEPH
ncbi:MFS transporter [Saccharopolyspora hattusasensis]|uniref:MFS transporter n=1 Tax=Saccharopolyspora hattusasensis TaxID=1128679 RepID=UPI003D96213B